MIILQNPQQTILKTGIYTKAGFKKSIHYSAVIELGRGPVFQSGWIAGLDTVKGAWNQNYNPRLQK